MNPYGYPAVSRTDTKRLFSPLSVALAGRDTAVLHIGAYLVEQLLRGFPFERDRNRAVGFRRQFRIGRVAGVDFVFRWNRIPSIQLMWPFSFGPAVASWQKAARANNVRFRTFTSSAPRKSGHHASPSMSQTGSWCS